ncbi:hypothetical protein [Streptococcus equi]|uniref:hypothetical protein n=1 Tax=Streptococcus equi TaxID=1336 RepID=UPI001E32DEFA|nr:hypothetical protein [Streptococcus equi]MCD3418456.1 hypothetical protein [Streptococcus equi subsp. zooepidemicus]
MVDECNKKEYISASEIDDGKIENFLKVVWFVIDDEKPEDYIRKIIEKHPAIIPLTRLCYLYLMKLEISNLKRKIH